MILNRLGNKQRIAGKIFNLFPKHDMYIEPFFGAGGMFFKKPLAKYNIVNDLDNDIYNLYKVIMKDRERFIDILRFTPIHQQLLSDWKKEKINCDIDRAVRFIVVSNASLFNDSVVLRIDRTRVKQNIRKRINNTIKKLEDVVFTNMNYEEFINSISVKKHRDDINKAFIYCDPPYLKTKNNYNTDSFSVSDLNNLIDVCKNKGVKFAISEFDSTIIRDIAKAKGLQINIIGERKNIKNRRVEVLLTNYTVPNTLSL